MPITVNKNTTGAPMSTPGRTGSQVIRLIPAPRIYFKNPDATLAAPVQSYFTVSNGVTPTGWTDLGIISGMAKITYDKKTKEVTTGIDQYLRAAYVESKKCTIDFELEQFDDLNLELLSGFTGSVITSGSLVNYQLGMEDLVQKAILVVFQNKLDGKEFQFYNPSAYINFVFNDGTNGMTLKVTALLPSFTASGQTQESFLSVTEFRLYN
jgi:hypothetical protein